MSPLVRLALAAGLVTPSALAQTPDDTGYNPDRNCHFYVMQRLPVPVRCMAQLIGNWSPHPFVDGDFLFRNHAEWLKWRDREDYRHWRNHDFTWKEGSVEPAAAATAPAAPPAPARQGTAALLCPAAANVHIVPDQAGSEGWNGSDRSAALPLDLKSPPRLDGQTLVCSYGDGRVAVTLTRPSWGHCAPRPDRKGFDCSP